jgi:hypothetical protein
LVPHAVPETERIRLFVAFDSFKMGIDWFLIDLYVSLILPKWQRTENFVQPPKKIVAFFGEYDKFVLITEKTFSERAKPE